ncbi:MAG: site-specific integrase, partial [Oscillospiraceae bacterium]|nr:site-specific integrase [Oscillospiraceae bacterium]
VPLTRITREAAQAFCESLQKRGFCANTVRDILGVLNSAMKVAKIENLILVNPCESIRLPQSGATSRRALDRREQALLEESLLSEGQSVELGVLLSLYAGLRIGEICALRWEDVDFSTHTLTVRGTLQRVALYDGRSPSKTGLMLGPPKSRRSFRSVPLPPDLSVILERRSGRGYVLTNCEEPVEPRTLRARCSRLTGRIGLPVPFQTLRHTSATRCLEHNFDFQTVAELLGHATADTTMRVYAHSVPEHKRFLTDRLRLLAPRYSHLSPPTSPEGRCAGC